MAKQVSVPVVKATKKVKYQIKRDLSGDVTFKNAPGIVAMTATSESVTDVVAEGFNFFKIRKVNLKAGSCKVKIGGVTKWTITAIGSATPAGPAISSTKATSETITLQAIGGSASIKLTQVPQINQKDTIMI